LWSLFPVINIDEGFFREQLKSIKTILRVYKSFLKARKDFFGYRKEAINPIIIINSLVNFTMS